MKLLKVRSILVVGILALVVSVFAVSTVSRAQNNVCVNLSGSEIVRNVPANGTYSVWLLSRPTVQNSAAYVQIDSGECLGVNLGAQNSWNWVSPAAKNQALQAGQHSFKLYVAEGSVDVDKVMITSDTSCVPTGDGQNCIEDVLDFDIQGVRQGGNATDQTVVGASIISSHSTAEFSFYIDDMLVSTNTEAPYCLSKTAIECEAYSFSGNGYTEGDHVLKVVGTVANQPAIERSLTFTLAPNTPSAPAPTPDAPSPQPEVTITGLQDAEKVSGSKTIGATVTNPTQPMRVVFRLNNSVVSESSSAPYCLNGGTACTPWSSSAYPNGNYTLIATVYSGETALSSQTVNFSIENVAVAPAETTKPTPQVVVGTPSQAVSGVVSATVPTTSTQNASTVTYAVNNNPPVTAPTPTSSVPIDTSTLTNGANTVTATITKTNGEKKVLKSTVQVKNDTPTSVANWIKEHALLAFGGVAIGGIGLTLLIHFGISAVRKRKMMQMHNLEGTYTYIMPQEFASARNVGMGGVAVVAAVVVVMVAGLRFAPQSYAAGLGFIAEAESGSRPSGEFVVQNDISGAVYLAVTRTQPSALPLDTSISGNILNEEFEGRGTALSNGTRITDSNSFARINYGVPVAGFYVNDVNNYTSAPNASVYPVFDSSVVKYGSYSAKFSLQTVGRATRGGSFYHYALPTPQPVLYSAMWWRMDQAMSDSPGADLLTIRTDYAGTQLSKLRLTPDNKLQWIRLDGGFATETGNTVYQPNTWYRIVTEFNAPNGTSRVVVKDENGEIIQDNTLFHTQSAAIGFFEFGALQGDLENFNSLASWWFEDVRLGSAQIVATPQLPAPTPTPDPTPVPDPTPPPTPPAPAPSSTFTQNFDGGTNASSVNFTDITQPGPHFGSGYLLVSGNRALPDPNALVQETFATANMSVNANQYAEADLIIGASTSNQYTGIAVRANISGPYPNYNWYKLEIENGNLRILELLNSRIGQQVYAPGFQFQPNRTYRLRLEANGNQIIGYIDGEERVRMTSNNIPNGTPGITLFGNFTAIDNFVAGNL